MVYLNSALALSLLAAVPTRASFEDSPISGALGEITLEKIDEDLNVDVEENQKNLKQEVAERTYARSGGVDLSVLETLTYVPYLFTDKVKCSSQAFGANGTYTDCVCGVHDALEDICDEETGCDSSLIQGVMAGKASMLEDNDYVSWALCAVANDDFNPAGTCEVGNLPQEDVYRLAANGVDFVVRMARNGFNNPLFTARMDLMGSEAPSETNKVLGDGALDLKFDAYDRLHPGSPFVGTLVEIDVKLSVLDAYVNQFAGSFADADEDCFYLDTIRGVIARRHKAVLFPDLQATKAVDVSTLKFKTHCALGIGIHAARKCGYDTGDMYDLMTWYFENKLRPNAPTEYSYWCHRFKPHKYTQAKTYMSNDAVAPTKAASPAECVSLMNL